VKLGPAVLLLCLVWAATSLPAGAHAVLQSSSPAHGSTLDAAPREVVLTFSEPVNPEASSAQVLDSSGRVVSLGSEVGEDTRTLRVKLSALSRGSYTVRWKVQSRLDGHLTAGALIFGVGQAPAAQPSSQPGPPWWQVVLRWVGYLAALCLAGALAFGYLVVPAPLRPGLRAVLRPVTLGAAVALAAASSVETVARAAWLQGPGQGLQQTLWALLRGSPEGAALLLRLGAAALAADAARGSSAWVAAVGAGAAVAGLTATSHAWASGPVAVAVDWLHLLAASLWTGGLVCLAFTLARSRTRETAPPVVRAFSRWAGASLAVVVATGLYGAVLHVPDWQALVDTGYGRWLVAKVGLVAAMVGLGAFNRYRILPQLASARGAVRRLQRSVRAEVVVAAAVLLSAAGLAVSPPARAVRAASATQELLLAASPGGLRVVLAVWPAQPGWNRFTLTVRDARGEPLPVDRPILRVRGLLEEGSTPSVELRPEGSGVYAAEGTYLASPGFWELEVVLRRRGRPDEVVWFPLRLGSFQLRSDLEAFRLLRRVQEGFERLRTWRETEQTTDGAGNVVVTHYTYQRPDRLAFQVVGGMEGVLVGKERFVRTDRGWQRDELPEPFAARGPAVYLQNPLRAALGRQEPCPHDPRQPCRVVLWESPDGLASFAAWVSTRTHRLHRLLMWAPAHAMTSVFQDFDAPLKVERPR
jgi:copper transport protein